MRDLVDRWRLLADGVREMAPHAAAAYERAARELTAALDARDADLLTLAQAARETGYSADHLARLVRERRLTNHGRHGAPRVRRGDLPVKIARKVA